MKKDGWPRRRLPVPGVAAAVLWSVSTASAQFGPPRPPVVIRGGTIHVGNGDVLKEGTLILRGREIEAVGVGLPVPEGAVVIEAAGKHVYPGLIDCESTLLLDEASRGNGEGSPVNAVADALDWFDRHAFAQAWAGGVTTVGVPSRRGLLDGPRAVVKMRRARGDDALLRKDGDLAVTFGLAGSRPSMVLRDWKSLREQLDATRKYVEAWEEYAEKIEEYKKALEKWSKDGAKLPASDKKEGAAPQAPPAGPQGGGPGEGGPRRGEGRRRPPGRIHDHNHDTPFMRWLQDTLGWMCDCGLPERRRIGEAADDQDHGKLILADGVSFAEEPANPAGDAPKEGDGAKAEEPKKPARPAKEPLREALRGALAGKSAVNVYVSSAADIENLVALLSEFPLVATVTGAGELATQAATLASARLPVVLVQPHDLGDDGVGAAAKLDAAGVKVALTTAGRSPGATRWLSLSAAAAIAGGLDREKALAAITSRAAAVLGVADRVGTLAVGKDADVLITSGDLFASTSVVERLYVDGQSVLERR
jgi:imidazolonepropionase-like amidohydrolase